MNANGDAPGGNKGQQRVAVFPLSRELAQDTLTGNLRGVLATLTPEAVNGDRLGFAKALADDAGEDLASLGFHLDVLKIQNVSDERGCLEAIGREKSAEA